MIRSNLRQLRQLDRTAFLIEQCRRQRVLHLGATDAPNTEIALAQDRFLHVHLNKVAASLVGMDNNQEMIALLSNHYQINNIRYGDIEIKTDYPQEEFDVVVAGEILEHLSNPGLALDALHYNLNLETRLIITVPNAYSFKGFCRALIGHELIHPDHTLHHSLRTLTNLLSRHGFTVISAFTFINGGAGYLASIANQLLRVFPQLAEGIGVVCRITEKDKNGSIR